MTDSFAFTPGWSFDAEKIAASEERLMQAGQHPRFADGAPSLRGNWKRLQARGFTAVLAQVDELKVRGKYRAPNTQARGTCVSQGSSRGAEDVNLSRIADGAIVGRDALLCFEHLYSYCRQHFGWGASHPWGCRCGRCPDGLMGSNGAECLALNGIIERGVYAGVDLTSPREDLAIEWGNNGGIPAQVMSSAKKHTFVAHRSMDLDEYADANSNKNWGAVCLPVIFTGDHDADGYCTPSGNGGHCTECCGIVLTPNGEDAFVMQQSWPISATRYPKQILTKGGPIELRPGSYSIRRSVLERYVSQGELWSFDLVGTSSFRG
jgi:hypothetical protein